MRAQKKEKFFFFPCLVAVEPAMPAVLWSRQLGGGMLGGGRRIGGPAECSVELLIVVAALLGRANLTGLVLDCIEAKFCKKICV